MNIGLVSITVWSDCLDGNHRFGLVSMMKPIEGNQRIAPEIVLELSVAKLAPQLIRWGSSQKLHPLQSHDTRLASPFQHPMTNSDLAPHREIPPSVLSQVAATAGRKDARTILALAESWRWALAFLKPFPDESIHSSKSGTWTKARAECTSTKACLVLALAHVLGRLTEVSQQPQ